MESSAAAQERSLPRPATRRGALWAIVATSLLVTAAAAVVATVAWLIADVDLLLVFAILRWCIVALLLVTPLVHQLFGARLGLRLPYALRTPATALLLTVESICVDILSARL